ncbi:unnamed protein product [Fraxinus pennsylvanica]|uniref:Glutamate receptor n=1 Tax=Fraxinus pennsylvanica TaxID=56036 RepID=A0AAD1Z0R1_9LAMI|nr:unnamed protein product [Fraxinus pennsylvanica]
MGMFQEVARLIPVLLPNAAVGLLKSNRMHAIVGLETSVEDELFSMLTKKAKIPIFSFAPTVASSTEYPYIVKIRSDETSKFEGIASIVKSLEWKDVVLIYEEDIENERKTILHLRESFEGKNIHISYRSVISSSFRDFQILKELHKLMTFETKIYIVHMTLRLVSRFLVHAKRLGMMKEEYAWIVTDKAMNYVHSMDFEVIESLQGALGFKPSIASSSKLHNITSRWRKEYHSGDSNMVSKELPVVGIWAYDTMQALAEAVERVSIEILNVDDHEAGIGSIEWPKNLVNSHGGMLLLHEVSQVRFEGLSGEFQLLNGKLYPEEFNLVNILQGFEEQMVGIWRPKEGILNNMYSSVCSMTPRNSKAIMWPRGCKLTPRGRLLQSMSPKKLRIGVAVRCSFKELVDVRYDPQPNAPTFSGFCIDVFKSAIEDLTYEVPYEFVPLLNGSYNDFVRQVYLKNIDGLVGDVTILANRSLYVDFTVSFTDLGVGTLTLTNEDIWSFLRPLDTKLWLVCGAFFLLTGFVVWAIERSNNNDEFRQGSVAFQVGTIFWFGFSTLVFAHSEKLTTNLSRSVVLVWVFAVLILTSSYTATLSSLLTVQQFQMGSTGEFLGVQGGSFVGELVANNLNFQDQRLKRYDTPEEYAEALSRGHKDGGVDAIIDEVPYIKIVLSKYSRDYSVIASSSTTNGFGFVFPKGSPLVPDISKAIIKLREEGKLLKMERTWFKTQSSLLPKDAVTNTNKLNFDQFGGLFLVLGICLATVIAIYITQLLLERFQRPSLYITLVNRGVLAFVLRQFFQTNALYSR